MANPLTILNALDQASIEISITAQSQLKGALEKALAALLPNVSLSSARRIAPGALPALEEFLSVSAGRKALGAIAKAWDPKSAGPSDLTEPEVAGLLIELIAGGREPYAPTQHSLAAARALPYGERADLAKGLSMLAPTKDLTALLRRWDKHGPSTGPDRSALLGRLLGLLEATEEPRPAPQTTTARSRKRATART